MYVCERESVDGRGELAGEERRGEQTSRTEQAERAQRRLEALHCTLLFVFSVQKMLFWLGGARYVYAIDEKLASSTPLHADAVPGSRPIAFPEETIEMS